MKEPSVNTIVAKPGFEGSGVTDSMVLPAHCSQLKANPGNCFMNATFAILAFHFSSMAAPRMLKMAPNFVLGQASPCDIQKSVCLSRRLPCGLVG